MASELGVQTIQHTNGTDALTIDSSGNVALSQVGSGDFYREGTFTPFFSSASATTPGESDIISSYQGDGQYGYYERIGNLVRFNLWLFTNPSGFSWQNGGGGSQTLYIGGLPFTIADETRNYPSFVCGYYNSWTGWTASYTPMFYGEVNKKYMIGQIANANSTGNITTDRINNAGSRLMVSGSYRTDDA